MAETASAPLTGKALLQKVKELSSLPRRETAKRCGYYTVAKNSQVRVNLTDFYDALLAARGIPLSPESSKDGRGREATYRVTVHKNGQIVIGSTYTEAMGLKPGDEFEIKLGYKHIHLIYLETSKNLTRKGALDEDEDLDEEEEIDEEERMEE
ncbi:MAG: AbrB family transcriptional regulator [Oscillatoria princeps RMCB-10]|jgi:AbrB family looped-hinge helix DNA binding protein|nr:AbrB family transcriptional regulator [Oscillatoria princeps RMCB-10]